MDYEGCIFYHNPHFFVIAHHPAMKCDFFRLCFLYKKGGFYVDADEVYTGKDYSELIADGTLKLQPLCYDLVEEKMVDTRIFLNIEHYNSSMIFYVNNNPIISPPGHQLLKIAIDRATGLLNNMKIKDNLGIQELAGPGNLSASLVNHSLHLLKNDKPFDFAFIRNWEEYSSCEWFLSYRKDQRNWRLYKKNR